MIFGLITSWIRHGLEVWLGLPPDTIDDDQVEYDWWNSTVIIRDLSFHGNDLMLFKGLPIHCVSLQIASIIIRLPLTNLFGEGVEVNMGDIVMLVEPLNQSIHDVFDNWYNIELHRYIRRRFSIIPWFNTSSSSNMVVNQLERTIKQNLKWNVNQLVVKFHHHQHVDTPYNVQLRCKQATYGLNVEKSCHDASIESFTIHVQPLNYTIKSDTTLSIANIACNITNDEINVNTTSIRTHLSTLNKDCIYEHLNYWYICLKPWLQRRVALTAKQCALLRPKTPIRQDARVWWRYAIIAVSRICYPHHTSLWSALPHYKIVKNEYTALANEEADYTINQRSERLRYMESVLPVDVSAGIREALQKKRNEMKRSLHSPMKMNQGVLSSSLYVSTERYGVSIMIDNINVQLDECYNNKCTVFFRLFINNISVNSPTESSNLASVGSIVGEYIDHESDYQYNMFETQHECIQLKTDRHQHQLKLQMIYLKCVPEATKRIHSFFFKHAKNNYHEQLSSLLWLNTTPRRKLSIQCEGVHICMYVDINSHQHVNTDSAVYFHTSSMLIETIKEDETSDRLIRGGLTSCSIMYSLPASWRAKLQRQVDDMSNIHVINDITTTFECYIVGDSFNSNVHVTQVITSLSLPLVDCIVDLCYAYGVFTSSSLSSLSNRSTYLNTYLSLFNLQQFKVTVESHTGISIEIVEFSNHHRHGESQIVAICTLATPTFDFVYDRNQFVTIASLPLATISAIQQHEEQQDLIVINDFALRIDSTSRLNPRSKPCLRVTIDENITLNLDLQVGLPLLLQLSSYIQSFFGDTLMLSKESLHSITHPQSDVDDDDDDDDEHGHDDDLGNVSSSITPWVLELSCVQVFINILTYKTNENVLFVCDECVVSGFVHQFERPNIQLSFSRIYVDAINSFDVENSLIINDIKYDILIGNTHKQNPNASSSPALILKFADGKLRAEFSDVYCTYDLDVWKYLMNFCFDAIEMIGVPEREVNSDDDDDDDAKQQHTALISPLSSAPLRRNRSRGGLPASVSRKSLNSLRKISTGSEQSTYSLFENDCVLDIVIQRICVSFNENQIARLLILDTSFQIIHVSKDNIQLYNDKNDDDDDDTFFLKYYSIDTRYASIKIEIHDANVDKYLLLFSEDNFHVNIRLDTIANIGEFSDTFNHDVYIPLIRCTSRKPIENCGFLVFISQHMTQLCENLFDWSEFDMIKDWSYYKNGFAIVLDAEKTCIRVYSDDSHQAQTASISARRFLMKILNDGKQSEVQIFCRRNFSLHDHESMLRSSSTSTVISVPGRQRIKLVSPYYDASSSSKSNVLRKSPSSSSSATMKGEPVVFTMITRDNTWTNMITSLELCDVSCVMPHRSYIGRLKQVFQSTSIRLPTNIIQEISFKLCGYSTMWLYEAGVSTNDAICMQTEGDASMKFISSSKYTLAFDLHDIIISHYPYGSKLERSRSFGRSRSSASQLLHVTPYTIGESYFELRCKHLNIMLRHSTNEINIDFNGISHLSLCITSRITALLKALDSVTAYIYNDNNNTLRNEFDTLNKRPTVLPRARSMSIPRKHITDDVTSRSLNTVSSIAESVTDDYIALSRENSKNTKQSYNIILHTHIRFDSLSFILFDYNVGAELPLIKLKASSCTYKSLRHIESTSTISKSIFSLTSTQMKQQRLDETKTYMNDTNMNGVFQLSSFNWRVHRWEPVVETAALLLEHEQETIESNHIKISVKDDKHRDIKVNVSSLAIENMLNAYIEVEKSWGYDIIKKDEKKEAIETILTTPVRGRRTRRHSVATPVHQTKQQLAPPTSPPLSSSQAVSTKLMQKYTIMNLCGMRLRYWFDIHRPNDFVYVSNGEHCYINVPNASKHVLISIEIEDGATIENIDLHHEGSIVCEPKHENDLDEFFTGEIITTVTSIRGVCILTVSSTVRLDNNSFSDVEVTVVGPSQYNVYELPVIQSAYIRDDDANHLNTSGYVDDKSGLVRFYASLLAGEHTFIPYNMCVNGKLRIRPKHNVSTTTSSTTMNEGVASSSDDHSPYKFCRSIDLSGILDNLRINDTMTSSASQPALHRRSGGVSSFMPSPAMANDKDRKQQQETTSLYYSHSVNETIYMPSSELDIEKVYYCLNYRVHTSGILYIQIIPPVLIRNLLYTSMKYRLYHTNSQHDHISNELASGECGIHYINPNQHSSLSLQCKLPGFEWSTAVDQLLSTTSNEVVTYISEEMKANDSLSNASDDILYNNMNASLTTCLHIDRMYPYTCDNRMHSLSSSSGVYEPALHLCIYSKYWMVNRTKTMLYLKDDKAEWSLDMKAYKTSDDDDDDDSEYVYSLGWYDESPSVVLSTKHSHSSSSISLNNVRNSVIHMQTRPIASKRHKYDVNNGTIELATHKQKAPKPFHRSSIITINPRFVFHNALGRPVYIKQVNTDDNMYFIAKSSHDKFTSSMYDAHDLNINEFYWVDNDSPHRIVISLDGPPHFKWSGCFDIDSVRGRYILNLQQQQQQMNLLQIDIAPHRQIPAILVIEFTEGLHKRPPYRVINRSLERIQVCQRDGKHKTIVEAKSSSSYCLEEPTLPPFVSICLLNDDNNDDDNVTVEYSLHILQDVPPMQFTNDRNNTMLFVTVELDESTKLIIITTEDRMNENGNENELAETLQALERRKILVEADVEQLQTELHAIPVISASGSHTNVIDEDSVSTVKALRSITDIGSYMSGSQLEEPTTEDDLTAVLCVVATKLSTSSRINDDIVCMFEWQGQEYECKVTTNDDDDGNIYTLSGEFNVTVSDNPYSRANVDMNISIISSSSSSSSPALMQGDLNLAELSFDLGWHIKRIELSSSSSSINGIMELRVRWLRLPQIPQPQQKQQQQLSSPSDNDFMIKQIEKRKKLALHLKAKQREVELLRGEIRRRASEKKLRNLPLHKRGVSMQNLDRNDTIHHHNMKLLKSKSETSITSLSRKNSLENDDMIDVYDDLDAQLVQIEHGTFRLCIIQACLPSDSCEKFGQLFIRYEYNNIEYESDDCIVEITQLMKKKQSTSSLSSSSSSQTTATISSSLKQQSPSNVKSISTATWNYTNELEMNNIDSSTIIIQIFERDRNIQSNIKYIGNATLNLNEHNIPLGYTSTFWLDAHLHRDRKLSRVRNVIDLVESSGDSPSFDATTRRLIDNTSPLSSSSSSFEPGLMLQITWYRVKQHLPEYNLRLNVHLPNICISVIDNSCPPVPSMLMQSFLPLSTNVSSELTSPDYRDFAKEIMLLHVYGFVMEYVESIPNHNDNDDNSRNINGWWLSIDEFQIDNTLLQRPVYPVVLTRAYSVANNTNHRDISSKYIPMFRLSLVTSKSKTKTSTMSNIVEYGCLVVQPVEILVEDIWIRAMIDFLRSLAYVGSDIMNSLYSSYGSTTIYTLLADINTTLRELGSSEDDSIMIIQQPASLKKWSLLPQFIQASIYKRSEWFYKDILFSPIHLQISLARTHMNDINESDMNRLIVSRSFKIKLSDLGEWNDLCKLNIDRLGIRLNAMSFVDVSKSWADILMDVILHYTYNSISQLRQAIPANMLLWLTSVTNSLKLYDSLPQVGLHENTSRNFFFQPHKCIVRDPRWFTIGATIQRNVNDKFGRQVYELRLQSPTKATTTTTSTTSTTTTTDEIHFKDIKDFGDLYHRVKGGLKKLTREVRLDMSRFIKRDKSHASTNVNTNGGDNNRVMVERLSAKPMRRNRKPRGFHYGGVYGEFDENEMIAAAFLGYLNLYYNENMVSVLAIDNGMIVITTDRIFYVNHGITVDIDETKVNNDHIFQQQQQLNHHHTVVTGPFQIGWQLSIFDVHNITIDDDDKTIINIHTSNQESLPHRTQSMGGLDKKDQNIPSFLMKNNRDIYTITIDTHTHSTHIQTLLKKVITRIQAHVYYIDSITNVMKKASVSHGNERIGKFKRAVQNIIISDPQNVPRRLFMHSSWPSKPLPSSSSSAALVEVVRKLAHSNSVLKIVKHWKPLNSTDPRVLHHVSSEPELSDQHKQSSRNKHHRRELTRSKTERYVNNNDDDDDDDDMGEINKNENFLNVRTRRHSSAGNNQNDDANQALVDISIEEAEQKLAMYQQQLDELTHTRSLHDEFTGGRLLITIVSANNLKRPSNDCNTHVSISFNNIKKRTNTIKRTSSPEWFEDVEFETNAKQKNDFVRFRVYHRGKFSMGKVCLGELSIPLLRLLDYADDGGRISLPLHDTNNISNDCGTLTFKTQLHDNNNDSYQTKAMQKQITQLQMETGLLHHHIRRMKTTNGISMNDNNTTTMTNATSLTISNRRKSSPDILIDPTILKKASSDSVSSLPRSLSLTNMKDVEDDVMHYARRNESIHSLQQQQSFEIVGSDISDNKKMTVTNNHEHDDIVISNSRKSSFVGSMHPHMNELAAIPNRLSLSTQSLSINNTPLRNNTLPTSASANNLISSNITTSHDKKMIMELQQKLRTYELEVVQLRERIDLDSSKRVLAERRVQRLTQELNESEERARSFEKRYNNEHNEEHKVADIGDVVLWAKEKRMLLKRLEDSSNECTAANTKIQQLKLMNDRLNNDVKRLERDCRTYQEKYNVVDNHMKKLNSVVVRVQQENAKLHTQRKQIIAQLRNESESRNNMKTMLDDTMNDNKKLRNDQNEAVNEICRCLDQIESLKHELMKRKRYEIAENMLTNDIEKQIEAALNKLQAYTKENKKHADVEMVMHEKDMQIQTLLESQQMLAEMLIQEQDRNLLGLKQMLQESTIHFNHHNNDDDDE